jgi:hypothetical protein
MAVIFPAPVLLVMFRRTNFPYARTLNVAFVVAVAGFDPSITQGGWTEDEHTELVTAVQEELSGLVSIWKDSAENPEA